MPHGNLPELPFVAYKGEQPFAFVSYSHADAESVYEELRLLKGAGVNVWYDEGISPGHAWPRELANTLDRCSLFIVYITENSVASDHCLRETHFAMQHGKPVLAIYAEDLTLPTDWEFAIGDRQGIMKDRLPDAMYREKLRGAIAEFLPLADVTAESVTERGADEFSAVPQSAIENAPLKRRWSGLILAVSLVAVVVGVSTAWYWQQQKVAEEDRRMLEATFEEIREHVLNDRYDDAYAVASAMMAERGEDALPQAIREQIMVAVDVESQPPGAMVSYRLYESDETWTPIGETPLTQFSLPRTMLMMRYEKPGFETSYRAVYNPGIFTRNAAYEAAFLNDFGRLDVDVPTVELTPADAGEIGMIAISTTRFPLQFPGYDLLQGIHIPTYLVDRLETTNAEFLDFVRAGGYEDETYWSNLDFIGGDEELDWASAMARFVDSTGRPGPAHWEFGKYPAGAADLPVHGISWFEAMAYASFRGRSLPTIYHWVRAAIMPMECCEPISPHLTRLSNFGNDLVDVGSSRGVGPYGTMDMAGNVAEWAYNASGQDRIVLGGSATDPPYAFFSRSRQSPWDRSTLTGLRTALYRDNVPADLLADVEVNDQPELPEPMPDDVYEAMQGAIRYLSFPRESRVEVENEPPYAEGVRLRTVSFRTGFADERFNAHIFMPTDLAPPYQPVVYMSGYGGFAGPGGVIEESFEWQIEEVMDPLLRTGRAVIWLEWFGSYSRYDGLEQTARNSEERTIAWQQRIGRWRQEFDAIVEYVETSTDLDNDIAFMGLSFGASAGAWILTGNEDIDVALMLSGGMGISTPIQLTAARSIDTPMLMLNARFDHLVSPQQSARFFEQIGTADDDKRLVVYETGHWPLPRHQMAREMVDWLDRYLGPVE
jgi:eukaryotic-like serine/threonine-protein kinase